MAMMNEKGELLHNVAFGRAAEVIQMDRKYANELTRMVIRWLRIFRIGRRHGYFQVPNVAAPTPHMSVKDFMDADSMTKPIENIFSKKGGQS